MHPDWRRICDAFVQATSYEHEGFEAAWEGRSYDRENRPETYLCYPDAVRRIPLGKPEFPDAPDFWTVLATRRSKRNFIAEPMSLNELNLLLWSSQGITADMGDYQLRTAPSSGALYPTETYLVVNAVNGLDPGLYHLSVKDWTLEAIALGDYREAGHKALRGQTMTEHAAVNFVWTCVIERCRAKYYERTYRYIWWDSATIGENMLLAANALGLGACLMGSWYDDLVHKLFNIDGREHLSVLTAAVGRVEGESWLNDRRPPAR